MSVIASADELDVRRSYLDQVAASVAGRSGVEVQTEVRSWPSVGRSLASRVTEDTTAVMATAATMHHRISPLAAAMFFETNPIPVKTALAMMGRIDPELRLPLVPMSDGARAKLEDSLRSYGLLKN